MTMLNGGIPCQPMTSVPRTADEPCSKYSNEESKSDDAMDTSSGQQPLKWQEENVLVESRLSEPESEDEEQDDPTSTENNDCAEESTGA